ncbi:MAG: hypothetical protein JNG84_09650 [Archangium sp.]|nr:hypothetical protein [Archangium sp.]
MSTTPALRPLDLGEIIDRSASTWRAHWKPLFQLFVGFQLAQYLVTKVLSVVSTRVLERATGGRVTELLDVLRHPPALSTNDALALFVTGGLTAGVVFVLSQISAVAGTAYIYPRITQTQAPTIAAALELALRRSGATLGTLLLSLGWTMIVSLLVLAPALAVGGGALVKASAPLAVVAAVLLVAGSLVLTVWYVVRFILMAQVTAVEPLSALGIFRRTDALSSGRVGPGFTGWVKGRLTLLVTVVFSLVMIISMVTSVPLLVVIAAYSSATGAASSAVPALLRVPAELVQVVATSTVAPLYVVFQTMFYVDVRVRREGLDLELAARGSTE